MNSLAHDTLMAMSLPAALGFVRNGVFIAIIANGLIGISLVWDKVLLKKPETRNLVSCLLAGRDQRLRPAFGSLWLSPAATIDCGPRAQHGNTSPGGDL